MSRPTPAQAAVLAATEVVPADWHDLALILQKFGGPNALIGGGDGNTKDNDRTSDLLRYLRRVIDPARIEYWLGTLDRLAISMPDVKFITINDTDYPANLKAAYGSPPFLFIRGTIREEDALSLAIVGNRRASPEGLKAASDIAATAAQHRITVISGLARGIDSAGHRGVIGVGGRTIAAIAAGIDHPLTRDSDVVLGGVLQNFGSIVSQFRPGSPPTSSSFLQRNGVISGLSLVSLAIEAGERSGTRNEIEHALRQGRRVIFWRPGHDTQSWVKIYGEEPLVSVASTESEVIEEVFDAARECARDDLLFGYVSWHAGRKPRSRTCGGCRCMPHVP